MQAVYQFILSFPLLVPSGYASDIAPGDLGSNLWAGMRCFAGFNTSSDDDCGLAPLFSTLYILFNLAYNVLIIAMLVAQLDGERRIAHATIPFH